jgi:hypothetical protein
MQRHASDSHGIYFRNPNTDLARSTTYLHNKSPTHNVVPNQSYSSWDNTLPEIIKMYSNYTKSRQIEGSSNNMFETVSHLQQQVNYLQNQLSETYSNNVITPKSGFLGISGYSCKRCRSFSWRYVKDPGYDMTMQAKHYCDEEKVKKIFKVPIRKIDECNLDNSLVNELLISLNSLIPGDKFLFAHDLTNMFSSLSNVIDAKTIYHVLGIPHRLPYSFIKDDKINWVYRAISNLGKRILMNNDEIKDFLRRLKSTYGLIVIPNGRIFRRIQMTIIP